jgi:hypothetical protein
MVPLFRGVDVPLAKSGTRPGAALEQEVRHRYLEIAAIAAMEHVFAAVLR